MPGFPLDHVGIVVPLPQIVAGRADHAHDLEGVAVRFRRSGGWGR